tara:strand:- start:173 stop:412 length:240 start_codon:yes stop_codon:yes gene_type:complete
MKKENEIRQALSTGIPVTVNGRQMTTNGTRLVVVINTGRGTAFTHANREDIEAAIIDPLTVEMDRVFDRIESLLERSAK